jgi:hypothetical protein
MMSLVSLAVVAAVQQPGGIQSARIAGSLRAVSHSIDTDVALLGPQPRASIDAPDLSTERSAANTSSSTRPLLCRPIQDRAARTISALDGHRASPNPLDRRR